MAGPLFEGPELRQASRVLGALLMIVGGAMMLFQTYLVHILPPADGFQETTALVTKLERVGTFRNPAFLVSLSYPISDEDGETQRMIGSQRVDFEIYYTLSEGDSVQIHYNAENPFDWYFVRIDNSLSDYALGLIMLIFGLFSLIFPVIVRWGSRQEDFELTDEWGGNPPMGVES